MTDATEERPALAMRTRLPRRAIAAALLVAGALALAVALAVNAGSGHPGTAAHNPRAGSVGAPHAARAGTIPATAGARGRPSSNAAPAPSRPAAGTPVGGARAQATEVRDPQEASSYPAPASVHHAAAAAPAKAGEALVAAGAPSDAEVRAELSQMQQAEAQARRSQQLRLAAVAGGHSIGGDGTIPIPQNVPEAVQRVVAGANAIADFPYVFGGGHGSFVDNAYDCSGSVSYALAAGGLIGAPETSGELESWGAPGPGRYITVLANPGHTYMYVNGMMFNTAGRSGVYASRWQARSIDNSGFVARHWPGL